MSVQTSFDGFVEDLAAQLAGYGFEQGEGGLVFRRFSPDGDALIVEVQISEHSSRHEKVFYLNVALVLAPKWEWDRQRTRRSASVLPQHFNGLWGSGSTVSRRLVTSGGLQTTTPRTRCLH
ncbi:hypothetical protein ACN28G_15170 [Micromonospora sp. WMMA1923]|uniref:hypothetical protein n=1 Tax=Micromonospora sp. WMMA1923 TaxID=3404125 RepID=UPI003B928FCB